VKAKRSTKFALDCNCDAISDDNAGRRFAEPRRDFTSPVLDNADICVVSRFPVHKASVVPSPRIGR